MNWSTASSGEARGELSRAISAVLERAREALEAEADLASAVHDTRKAIKRARALLRLADPGAENSQTDSALREASRTLAVVRDADVLVLTAKGIRDGSPSEPDVVPRELLECLEEERGRRFTESHRTNGPIHEVGERLSAVIVMVQESRAPEAAPEPALELLRLGLVASYASVRERSDPTVGDGPADERSHKLRKRVKDLRYQLEFLDTGHPKLTRLVRDLHHLTDLLGDRNDLAMLSAYTASAEVLTEGERAALITHVEGGKQALQSEATLLSARLFQEEADSFVRRIEAWVTGPQG